jgi:hypothetical protein
LNTRSERPHAFLGEGSVCRAHPAACGGGGGEGGPPVGPRVTAADRAVGPVDGTVTVVGATAATFTPTSALAFNRDYTACLTTGITDTAGNPLAADHVWTFNTGAKLAAGEGHTCARLDDGQMKRSGRNNTGQLGLGDVASRGDGPNEMGANLPAVDLGD